MLCTKLSFESQGAISALSLLKSLHAPNEQSEMVREAIIRHQDVAETGKITMLTAAIQLATLLDNAGLYTDLLHPQTIRNICLAYPCADLSINKQKFKHLFDLFIAWQTNQSKANHSCFQTNQIYDSRFV